MASSQQQQQTNLKPVMPKKVGMQMPMMKKGKGKKKGKKKGNPSFGKVAGSIKKTMGY